MDITLTKPFFRFHASVVRTRGSSPTVISSVDGIVHIRCSPRQVPGVSVAVGARDTSVDNDAKKPSASVQASLPGVTGNTSAPSAEASIPNKAGDISLPSASVDMPGPSVSTEVSVPTSAASGENP